MCDRIDQVYASAGNRTRGLSMATTDFTTKPPMLLYSMNGKFSRLYIMYHIYSVLVAHTPYNTNLSV